MIEIIGFTENSEVEIREKDRLYIVDRKLLNFTPVIGDKLMLLRDENGRIAKVILKDEPPTNYKVTPVKTNTNTGFVLGILSTVFSGMNYLGIPFVHLVGIIIGSIGLYRTYKENDKEKFTTNITLNTIGIILGIIAAIIGIITAIL